MTRPEAPRRKTVEELFNTALERDPSEREAFLQQACDGDAALLEEVRALLGEADSASRLHVVDGASHLFPGDAPKAANRVVEAATHIKLSSTV